MTFKILSLDGGGIRGVLSATILKEVETTIREKKGQELHEYFDLIAGTSTGSILAASIACQLKAEEMISLYLNEGKNIFLESVRCQRKWRLLGRFFGSQVLYPHECGERGLVNVLKKYLIHPGLGKSPTIAEIKKPQLLLLAYDVLSRNTTWFANDDPTEWYYKNNLELWKICTASASAPTFFPPYNVPYNSEDFLPHIDGGVAANNPELAAIAHALSMEKNGKLNAKIDEIAVLSIGTGKTTNPYTYDQIKNWGLLEWVTNIPNIFLDPPAENSEYISRRILMGISNQNYLRLDFDLNERFEETRQPGKLRKLLKKPYNKYIYQKTHKIEKINEDIDNPDNSPKLKEAAECYLDYGEIINYPCKGKKVPVRCAIQKFIECH
ncbi:patatin-like phospholipase family protein [Oscillatoria salina]|uniref:patatin-like phospholipase family protein n=1 Tax=Oscillatoria salina TaxID=331517 RepID=UPI0013B86F8F|nr:patatin-like phospholipase family protein [Oscillatoria salina]MBZ8182290.1 patatin-like phospholipase family protein [Oscillatoria salina IIICB1]NET89175.1 patatin-like phospholipase family protein [Kamptonema sp. SIO1D9]